MKAQKTKKGGVEKARNEEAKRCMTDAQFSELMQSANEALA